MPNLNTNKPSLFPISIEQEALDDLKQRIQATRWPEKEAVNDWSQGIPLAYVKDICEYWATSYDWRRCEKMINDFGSYKIEVGGLDFHFLHVKSTHANARPLLITHGWPGSIAEFFELIPMLTQPENFGGSKEDAFHIIAPSLPGYGFSGKPSNTGWNVEKTADAWAAIMNTLGYEQYFAQGGDWGAMVTTALSRQHPKQCKAIHVNLVVASPNDEVLNSLTDEETTSMEGIARHYEKGEGYAKQQSTKPQTLGYGLTDSPTGQAAWILEKFYEWTDHSGSPDTIASRDQLLDNVMLYWLTASAASSARLYWESYTATNMEPMDTPVGCTVFPKEIFAPSKRWTECRFSNLIHWNRAPKGGHFAALEQPAFLAQEIRDCFRSQEL